MNPPKIQLPASSAVPSAPLAVEPVSQHRVLLAPMASNTPSPAIVTKREWVVPPRPKPGRKPATDPPPTKRKAQNRAAQRAFRERRAARVGELEEELEETKEEQRRREGEMRKRIATLEADVLRFTEELQSWKMRCYTLDRIAEYERGEKEAALVELSYIRKGALATSTDAVPMPPRRTRKKEPEAHSAPELTESTLDTEQPAPLGCDDCSLTQCACVERAIAMSTATCGRCSVDTRCECLEETIKAASDIPATVGSKRSHSPQLEEHASKRHHPPESATRLEIDFTAQFSSKAKPQIRAAQDIPAPKRQPAESCGFCEDGTFCVCAEAAADATAQEAGHGAQQQAAPLLNEITPPPSDTDINGGRNPSKQAGPNIPPPNTHGTEPGTCQQCQADPRSSTFCRSLAALRSSSNAGTKGDCCGVNQSGGPCCKTLSLAQDAPSLSCADTYRVLSTNRGFTQTAQGSEDWLTRLQTTAVENAERLPLEVEAASVMSLLRHLDCEFGKE